MGIVKFWTEKLRKGTMGEYCYDMLQDMAEIENTVKCLQKEQATTAIKLQECIDNVRQGERQA